MFISKCGCVFLILSSWVRKVLKSHEMLGKTQLETIRSRAGWLFNKTLRTATLLTETWLNPSILDLATDPEGLSIHHLDGQLHRGRAGGRCVCFIINNKWCSDAEIISTACSPNLEHHMIGCHMYYLLREFTLVILIVVYISPHAVTN